MSRLKVCPLCGATVRDSWDGCECEEKKNDGCDVPLRADRRDAVREGKAIYRDDPQRELSGLPEPHFASGVGGDEMIEEIRERLSKATPGPWNLEWNGQHLELRLPGEKYPLVELCFAIATWEPEYTEQKAECDTADIELMAHAPTDIAFLLQENEGLRAAVKRMKVHECDLRDLQVEYDFQNIERDQARAEVQRLRAAIEKAPHAHECASRVVRINKQPCTCWKRTALGEETR